MRRVLDAALHRSEPLGFVEKVFEFVARESDLFKSDSDVNAVFRMIRSKMEESRKNAAAEAVKVKETKPEQEAKAPNKLNDLDMEAEEKKRKESEKKAALRKREESLKVKEAGTKPEEEASSLLLCLLAAPNKSNGLDMDTYSWGQSLKEVNVYVHVPPGTKPSLIVCEIKKNHLKVGVKGQPPVIDGELFNSVKVDDCFWSLEDRKFLSIVLTKQDGIEWWKYVVKGEPEIDIRKAEPEPSFFS
ncbi:hypothetical protein SASPL_149313 [Salvia splendens]|uniref:CS domain-containing protein n=1 Tax=Salvia splendens TaxID=180675 RepID=A0A8X8Z491_SALSN|nr:hypothetical protein SASPL_149313 [Salvia splendens]